MSIYHNSTEFIYKGNKIRIKDLIFHKKDIYYNIFNRKIFKNFFQLVKLIFILRKFKKHYEKFKKQSVFESQINCLRKDKYLWDLYNTKTDNFLENKKIKNIVYDYMAQVLHGTAFTSIKNLNAFTFLHFSLPLIVPVYQFIFKKKYVEDLLKESWIGSKVVKIYKNNEMYEVTDNLKNKYLCKNVIVATPPHIAKKLIGFKDKLRSPVKAHMYHIIGEIKPDWNRAKNNLFRDESRMLAISCQKNGSFLFYSKHKNPDFNKYFYNYKILKHNFWNPAFHIKGSNILNFKHGENLYIIGDNNICGLEDSFIYGKYAANKILEKAKD